MADIVLPATMFMEHDDIYQGGGHQYIMLGPKLIEPPGECRTNHEVIVALAQRLGAEHPGFRHDAARVDRLDAAEFGLGRARPTSKSENWIDCQPDFETAHYLDGFAWPDGKFRFKPDWTRRCRSGIALADRAGRATMPALPDHWEVIEEADAEHPFRLATSPARNFLNSTFNETPTRSRARSGRP